MSYALINPTTNCKAFKDVNPSKIGIATAEMYECMKTVSNFYKQRTPTQTII